MDVDEKDKVSCQCGFESCKDCTKTYLLGQTREAHCMSCKTGWTMKFLYDNFKKGWINGCKEGQWRAHCKKVALDREKARLPETLAEIPRIKARERAEKEYKELRNSFYERRKQINETIKELKRTRAKQHLITPKKYTKKLSKIPVFLGEEKARLLLGYGRCAIPEGYFIRITNAKYKVFRKTRAHTHWYVKGVFCGPTKHKDTINWLAKKSKNKRCPNNDGQINKMNDELREIRRIEGDAYNRRHQELGIEIKVKAPTFICPCPDDKCKGMIETANFTCVKCEMKVCRRCREEREFDEKGKSKHKCNEDVLKNVKFLRNDTKPCPNCATAIHKISGCDQMFCVSCKTAFSWRTGKIETGTIHNPHALEWQRQRGGLQRDINDIPCGGLIPFNTIDRYLGNRKQREYIEGIHRVIGEIRYNIRPPRNDFSKFRTDYVMDRLTEKQWQQKIFNRERENARRKARADILVTLRTLAIERFRNLAETLNRKYKADVVADFIDEMEEIRTFINQAFRNELPPLGTKKPLQITNSRIDTLVGPRGPKHWRWNHRVY